MLTSSAQRIGEAAVLRAAGRIEGADRERWTSALQVVAMLGSGPILIDLTNVEAWTTSAQHALLRAAQQAAHEGRQVVVCGVTYALKTCTQLPVFDQLPAVPVSAEVIVARHDLTLRWPIGRRRPAVPRLPRQGHPAASGG